tara:strand:+ start:163 stop:450 length:288 start_codon:yes stop_codon:yes gene_type:complete
MPNQITINLTDSETKKLEMTTFEIQGLQNAINQFLYTMEFEYNEEHYNRFMKTYLQKYSELQQYILDLVIKYKNENVDIVNYRYNYGHNILTVET